VSAGEGLVVNREKGELRIFGGRFTAVNAQMFCDLLDALVGTTVSAVQMHSVESRLGKEDVERIRRERPQATVQEIINLLIETDCVSGVGITRVTLSGNQDGPIFVEISNPSVKGTVGAAKTFGLSWWAGAMSALFNRPFDLKDVVYDKDGNMTKGRLVPRPVAVQEAKVT